MKKTAQILLVTLLFTLILSLSSCMNAGGDYDGAELKGDGTFGGAMSNGSLGSPDFGESDEGASEDASEGESSDELPPEETEKEEQIRLPSGMITAGAWNDNDNYKAWLSLFGQSEDGEGENGKFFDFTKKSTSWGFESLRRIKVTVSKGDALVSGATVLAKTEDGRVLFGAKTDANGIAYLFTDEENGILTVTSGEGSADAAFTKEERDISVTLDYSAEKLDVIELMLVVDVTGSMGDEIYFLKAELSDVIERIALNNENTVIKLAMLFYRDTDDEIPFAYYDFVNVSEKEGLNLQKSALDKQYASGGGDYPEAVDDALSMAVGKQWSTGATTKIIFHVLDAPAHDSDDNKEKLVNVTKYAAEKGIRICPIICSGASVDTEYTMREAAIYTGGTFIFVTDDSGIGGSHHDPGLPNATVELLNSLMVRLVNGYHTGTFEPPVYWKDDPNLFEKPEN